ncbi:cache domain-containing sensor histidine kinase [Robinsoniella peoriensis]|uniref:cache domain-containing sensor histidine kinase n=1 Tax=Robinsoniella peoriensis TaxID=180332 RepID=UPI00085C7398|nr:histidine kinase [Robinsoniella peoriensis]
MNIRKVCKRVRIYCRSHMWCSFAAAICFAVLLVVVVMQYYLKNEYLKYLIDSTYDTEKMLLSSVNQNIKNQMDDFIKIGSEIAVDDTNADLINEYSTNPENIARNTKDLKNLLANYARYSQYIAAIAIASKDGLVYQYERNENTINVVNIWNDKNNNILVDTFIEVNEISKSMALPRYQVITKPSEHPGDASKQFMHIAYPVRGKHFYQDIEYIMVVTFKRDVLDNLIGQLSGSKDDVAQGFISDKSGEIFYHTNSQNNGKKMDDYIKEEHLTDLSKPIGVFDWNLNIAINKNALQAKVNEMYTRAIALYALVIIGILLILFWVTQRILKPVDTINRSIKNVKKGNMQERIEIKGTHEIWQLANEYNEMMHAIRKMNRQVEGQHLEVVESLKMKQRAEREALESQINAHFICNTLNAINYEAIESGNYKVSTLLKKLSNILRYTFDQKHQNVYMYQEITWIEQYLYLQKERLENVFDYSIEFNHEYDQWPCRKLMLQPFVENSILHGFEGREEGGMIHITGTGMGEYLCLSIEDNGMGMTREREKIIQEVLSNPVISKEKEVGIGISNVVTRMKMYYGSKLQVSLETSYGKGCRFTFLIPRPYSIQEVAYEDYDCRR